MFSSIKFLLKSFISLANISRIFKGYTRYKVKFSNQIDFDDGGGGVIDIYVSDTALKKTVTRKVQFTKQVILFFCELIN